MSLQVLAELEAQGLGDRLREQPPWVIGLLLLGLLLSITGLFSALRRRKRSGYRPAAGTSARDQLEGARAGAPANARRDHRADMDAIGVEIEQLARRVGAQLDNKAARLETLLNEAERTISRLESATAAAKRAALPAHDLLATSPAASAQSSDDASEPQPRHARLTHDVHGLADQGLDAAAIAKAVDQPVGNVELILALRRAAEVAGGGTDASPAP